MTSNAELWSVDMAVESREKTPDPTGKEIAYERHPILDVPEDILRLIFEHLCAGSGNHRNKLAYGIGLVNKQWRDASRRTPNIWRCLDIDIAYSVSALAAQYKYITSIRPDPDVIRIYRSRGDDTSWNHLGDILRECRISELKFIDHLSIYIYKPYLVSTILDNLPLLKEPRIRELSLSVQSKRRGSRERIPWDATRLPLLIPGAKKLYISHHYGVQFFTQNFQQISSITFLDIYRCKAVHFLPRIGMFTNLKKLWVRSVECSLPPLPFTPQFEYAAPYQMVDLPALETLCIAQTPNFPWDYLSCPSLGSVVGDEDVSQAMIRFLQRHPRILELDVCVDSHLFELFTLSCPQLETLDIRGHIEGLVDWQKNKLGEWDKDSPGIGAMSLPNLKKLILDRVDKELTLELLEAIVENWCHPRSPASSTAEVQHRSRNRFVPCLGILGETKDLYSPPWMESTLLKGCERSSRYLPHLGHRWTCVEFRWSTG